MLSHRHHSRCACAGAPFALAGTERKYERSRPFVTTHLQLDLTVDFDQKSVEGTATLHVERKSPLDDELVLDAIGFELRHVRVKSGHGKTTEADYGYDGDQIRIALGKLTSGEIEIGYRAVPRLGLYFLAPDRHVKNRPRQVWSQCQDEDARHWFPCQDKPHVKMTTELRVRVPHGMTALSNGELIESDTPSRGKQPWMFHYALRSPHPSYLVTLVIGEFAEMTGEARLPSGRVVPLRYLVPPGEEAQGQRAFSGTPQMIEHFSEVIGVEYPWERYSQVVVADFIFGGMENTTATTMYEHILLDERAALDVESHDLVAHELAHQWFGDLVTCRDWSHAWLNEGFATFFEGVEREHRLGRDEYEHGVEADLADYLGEASGSYQRAIVCRDYEEPIDLFDRHLYQKGGLVLHMLRRTLGDTVFWSGVKKYVDAHKHGIVETNDLMRALEVESGRSLERFFDQWVYRPGHPVLEVKVGWEKGLLTVDVEQTQKGDDVAVFHFPLEIELEVGGKKQRHRREVTGRKEALAVQLDQRPAWVAFDPDFLVAAPVTLKAPSDMLRTQLRKAPTARLRRVAAEALAERQDPPTVAALRACLENADEAWMVRNEAAASLGRIQGPDAFAALAASAKTEHPKVRRAVVTALGRYRTPESAALLEPLAKRDRSYVVSSAAARSLGKTGDKRAFDTLQALLDVDSWAEVVRAGALDGLATLGDERATDALIERTKYGQPMRARRAALSALPRLAEGRKVREHLITLLGDADPHIRAAVVAALDELGDAKARGPLHEHLEHELEGRVIRRIKQALASLGGDKKRDLRKIREEAEKLKDELGELKARLSKLEQTKSADKAEKNAERKEAATSEKPGRTKRAAKKAPSPSKPPAAPRAKAKAKPAKAAGKARTSTKKKTR
jgi:aminopeptidase N